MDWREDGILLSAARHGESSAIAEVLTRDHGRWKGLVRGGSVPRLRGVLQPGNQVAAAWRARLAEHLGSFRIELKQARAAAVLGDPLRLSALSAVCALASATLPERQPHAPVYDGLLAVLGALTTDGLAAREWASVLARWELGLLAELGYGLDLEACAATGTAEGLIYVSPRSGRAVSAEAGAPYKEKLLPLPPFLTRNGNGNVNGDGAPAAAEVLDALRLTGHFLDRRLFRPHDRKLPAARGRFLEKFGG